ncbi:MAG: amidase [Acidobacteria bacterium]|nr:MAG: amidase [Acidobacteriota bacterium]
MGAELWSMDTVELASAIARKEVSAQEATEAALSRISALNPRLNAFVYLDADSALESASRIDSKIRSGDHVGPLAGVPIGVKDLEDVADMPTTHGSLLFQGNIAPQDSIQVERLREADAVILGKTAAPEFGSVSFTDSKIHGPTHNPWMLDRTPGGSSGGSAAAVAAGMVSICTGSDGGGSVRIPAAYSGLAGPKTTYGLIPNGPGYEGMSHTAHMGPLARTVRDAARYLDVTAGSHPFDPYSIDKPVDSFEAAVESQNLAGLKAAWSDSLGFGTCDQEVSDIAHRAAEILVSEAGIEWVSTSVVLKDPARAWQTLGAADLVHTLKPFWPDRADELTPVVRAGMAFALNLPIEELAIAAERVHDLNVAVERYFEDFDLLLTPTTATTAYDAAGPLPMVVGGQPVKPMGSLPFTYPFNLTWHPAMSVPAGLTEEGLPVGLQIVARRREDALVLTAARALERAQPWQKFAPLAYEA